MWAAVQRAASQPPGPARTTRTRSALRSPTALLLVTGEPVVGMLLVELVARRLELTMLCVAPEGQRAGVGRSLLEALVRRYPSVHTWSRTPEVCEALGLTRTGQVREEAVELVTGIVQDREAATPPPG